VNNLKTKSADFWSALKDTQNCIAELIFTVDARNCFAGFKYQINERSAGSPGLKNEQAIENLR
jgi:hypothetical protein